MSPVIKYRVSEQVLDGNWAKIQSLDYLYYILGAKFQSLDESIFSTQKFGQKLAIFVSNPKFWQYYILGAKFQSFDESKKCSKMRFIDDFILPIGRFWKFRMQPRHFFRNLGLNMSHSPESC